jgi:predicted regulator of amino acid metabolism with ACT domain
MASSNAFPCAEFIAAQIPSVTAVKTPYSMLSAKGGVVFAMQLFKVLWREHLSRAVMWERIRTLFETRPERLQVAKFLLQNGLSVKADKIYVNEVEIPTLKVARVIGVDRRTVNETIRAINMDNEIKMVFSKLESAGPSLRAVAKQIGLGVVEITSDNPNEVGILANAARILAEHGISVRQALVDDPEISPDPKLTLIGDRVIPGKAIPLILKIRGVAKVSVY